MKRFVVLLAACTWIATVPAAQDSGATKEAGGRPSRSAPKDGAQDGPVGGAKPPAKGGSPDRVRLGEPVQPTQMQTRDGGQIQADPRAKLRTVVKMMLNVERAHRDRVSRLERLRSIYAAAGAADKIATVTRLREVEGARYELTLQGYARDLGPDVYRAVRAAIDANAGTPPSAIDGAAPAAGASEKAR